MASSTIKFDKTLIASALSLAFITITPSAMATVITAKVDYTIGAGAPVNATDTSSTTPSNVDVIGSSGNPSGDIFYHTFGNTAGNFGSRVSGNGLFDITGSYTFFDSYTNSSNVSEDFNFGFTVVPGEISVSGNPMGPESLFSSYDLSVMVDFDQDGTFDSTIFNSFASLSKTNSDLTGQLVTSGTPLGGTLSEFFDSTTYSWGPYTDSIFVGSILPADSFDLKYVLTTTASSTVPHASQPIFECGGEGPTDEIRPRIFVDLEGINCDTGGSATSRIGDPIGGFFNVTSQPTPSRDVSAPSGIALLGLSFSIMYVSRRRKLKLK
jgi:hypothetical protein